MVTENINVELNIEYKKTFKMKEKLFSNAFAWIMKQTKEMFDHKFISKVMKNFRGYIVVNYYR